MSRIVRTTIPYFQGDVFYVAYFKFCFKPRRGIITGKWLWLGKHYHVVERVPMGMIDEIGNYHEIHQYDRDRNMWVHRDELALIALQYTVVAK